MSKCRDFNWEIQKRPVFNSVGIQVDFVWEARCPDCDRTFDVQAVLNSMHRADNALGEVEQ